MLLIFHWKMIKEHHDKACFKNYTLSPLRIYFCFLIQIFCNRTNSCPMGIIFPSFSNFPFFLHYWEHDPSKGSSSSCRAPQGLPGLRQCPSRGQAATATPEAWRKERPVASPLWLWLQWAHGHPHRASPTEACPYPCHHLPLTLDAPRSTFRSSH